jgi:DNA-binding transcriptional MerR regulator
MNDERDQLLTASDAARILGLSRDMVRILSQKGILPSQRTANGYHLFRRGDVEKLARERAEKRVAGRSREAASSSTSPSRSGDSG